MTGKKILESLQYVEDELVEEAAEYRPPRRKSLRTWGGLAACLVLLLGAALLAGRALAPGRCSLAADPVGPGAGPASAVAERPIDIPGGENAPVPGGVPADPGAPGAGPAAAVTERPIDIPGQYAPVPGGVPGDPGDPAPAPEIFAWSSDPSLSPPGEASTQAYVILVSQELTAEQVKACAPGIRLAWMADFSGYAAYRLADGSGGLDYIQMDVAHEELGNRYRIFLQAATEENLATSGLTGSLPSMDGQGYRAQRESYAGADGERVMILVSFVREGILYTLNADVPKAEETPTAVDLRDLFLAYAGTHSAPDLSSFSYTGGQG